MDSDDSTMAYVGVLPCGCPRRFLKKDAEPEMVGRQLREWANDGLKVEERTREGLVQQITKPCPHGG